MQLLEVISGVDGSTIAFLVIFIVGWVIVASLRKNRKEWGASQKVVQNTNQHSQQRGAANGNQTRKNNHPGNGHRKKPRPDGYRNKSGGHGNRPHQSNHKKKPRPDGYRNKSGDRNRSPQQHNQKRSPDQMGTGIKSKCEESRS